MVDKMKPKTLGLRQQIAKAETKDEILMLLGRAQSPEFDQASAHTRTRWRNTARNRLRQLGVKEVSAPATA
jgi:hypothetical protein